MFLGMIARFKRKLKPRDFCRIFNNSNMGRKVYNRLLRKAGVHSEGNAVIRPPFVFERGNLRLGSRVFINAGCVFLDEGGIEVGAYSLIGPGVKVCTVSHHVAPAERHDGNITGKVVLGENTWIGAGAVILPGVTIGANSVVAANSVVTKDIPANTLFAGSPAVFKKHL